MSRSTGSMSMPESPSPKPRARTPLASRALWIVIASVVLLVIANAWVAVGEMQRIERERALEDHIRWVQSRLERTVVMEASEVGSAESLDRLSATAEAFRSSAPIGAALSSTRDEALAVTGAQIAKTAKAVEAYRDSPEPATRATMLAVGAQAADRLDELLRALSPGTGHAFSDAVHLIPVLAVNLLLLAIAALGLRAYTSGLIDGRTSHDGLTGVPNRRMFQQTLTQEASRSHRYRRPLSLLVIDVDGMRAINANVGLDGGDRILRKLGARAMATLRASDEVFRIEGQQFAVVAPETDIDQARILAERLREAVAALEDASVTISIGLAEHAAGERPQDLYARSQEALHEAKRKGGSRVQAAPSPSDRASGTG
jgi:diguanylate cyclase (GGDEF)-like protein